MTRSQIHAQALRLSASERLELAEILWSSVEDETRVPPALPKWQRQTLDARIAADDADPDRGASWAEAKHRVLAGL